MSQKNKGVPEMGLGRIILFIFGILVIVFSFALLFGGGAVVWANSVLKDAEGFISTGTITLERDSYAIITEPAEIDLRVGMTWTFDEFATIKVEGTSNDESKEIFIGVAEESSVNSYLTNVEHDEIIDFEIHPYSITYINFSGSSEPPPPTTQEFWTASVSGEGLQVLEWDVTSGNWVLVVMNSDGSDGVDVSGSIGVALPSLLWIGVGLLIGGVLVLAVGILMVVLAVRR
jgi:hypothetical protein